MKIKYNVCKGMRINKSSFRHKDKRYEVYFDVCCNSDEYAFFDGSKEWEIINGDNSNLPYCTGVFKVHSVKAFKRRLRKWSAYMPKGTKFTLCSTLRGNNIIGVI